MLTKQYSIKVCEVDLTDKDEFKSFFEKNHLIFRNHLILINGELTKDIEMFLNNKGLKYAQNLDLPKGKASSKALEEELEKERQKNLQYKQELEQKVKSLSNRLQKNLKVLDTLVRSGQELNIDGDLLLLNRVNSGATIKTTGSLIITQVVDGAIRCNGDFMMLKASPKANIVFHNVEVDNSYLKDRLNRVELINNEIRITPVLKETNWAK